MRTRSSPPQSEDGHHAASEKGSGDKTRCEWIGDNIIQLINCLIDHKSDAGDSATFKSSVWTSVSEELEKTRIQEKGKGGPKTSKACSDKWAKVCRTTFRR